MRVLINGACLLRPRTGVGHTTANLHRALENQFPGDAFWLYPGSFLGEMAARVLRRPRFLEAKTTTAASTPTIRGMVGTVVKQAARTVYRSHLQTSARWGRFDLYHEPNFVAVRTTLPTVLTIHDLSVLTHPEWHPADRVRFHERHFHSGVEKAAHVIVVSETVRREAIEILGLSPTRVSAVYNGLDEQFHPRPVEEIDEFRHRAGLPSRYFLAVGTIEPRKNIGTLMRAFCDLPAEVREACPLVLAGNWGWKSDGDHKYYESVASAQGVRHLGYVDARDLPRLYAGAAALLYPTHYEGFGLPPIEMLACGGRVVASTDAAVREVLGPHAQFVHAHDEAGWREAMREIATSRVCEPNEAAIEHARGFTWTRAAAQTRAVYEAVITSSHA